MVVIGHRQYHGDTPLAPKPETLNPKPLNLKYQPSGLACELKGELSELVEGGTTEDLNPAANIVFSCLGTLLLRLHSRALRMIAT